MQTQHGRGECFACSVKEGMRTGYGIVKSTKNSSFCRRVELELGIPQRIPPWSTAHQNPTGVATSHEGTRGTHAARLPYLRVVGFEGIAVIRGLLADAQLLSHLRGKAQTAATSSCPAPLCSALNPSPRHGTPSDTGCAQQPPSSSSFPLFFFSSLSPRSPPGSREGTWQWWGAQGRTSPRSWEWGPRSKTPVRLQKPMPQRMRLFQLELRSK